MKIGVDLDGTVSEYPEFFSFMTRALVSACARVHVITDRPIGTEWQVAKELEGYGVVWDEIVITGDKAGFIAREGVEVLFDDVDQYFEAVPQSVAVFKVRQHYNYDFEQGRWR
ncbi:hypothetical protein [Anaerohalosphaera lusitana]|uniref:hypothetical protein n=1 Tax=Anaerohalosphaera lusitana TaxID=1936003 RepID=UPI0011BAC293|nr:hypothetical protein [Anaerohalosphaera lusitana]